jgi:internalin A
LNLVAYAPERTNLDKSLKRSNIKSLSVDLDDRARYVKRGIAYGEEDEIVDFVSLPVGLPRLTKLTSITFQFCTNLQNVDVLANCANLTSLELASCDSLENVNFLANLTNLTDLTLSFRLADEQWEDEDMEIVGDSSIKNIDGLNNCTKLTSLEISRSDFLFDLSNLSNLSNLTNLNLYECGFFDNVDGLANLTNLTSLGLAYCDALENVDGLANLTKLTKLDLSDCHPIVQPKTEVMTTRKKVIEYQDRIRFVMTLMDGDTNVLSDYKDSTSLDLSGCNLQNVDALANLTNLTSLNLRNSSSFTSLPVGLNKLTNLTSLDLSGCSSLQNVDGLAGCTKLTELYLDDCESLQNVDGLANLTKLTKLDLSDCSSLPVLPENDDMTTRNEVAAYQEQIKKALQ